MNDEGIARVFRDQRLNAGLAWSFVGIMTVVALAELVTGQLLSAGFTLAVVVLVVVPTTKFRTPWIMLPWEVVALASLPTVGRALATWPIAGSLATYLAVAAVALVIAVELHAFTPVRMTYGFAVLFVVVTTLATAGTWAVVRWLSDQWLGTAFLTSESALMWEFVWSSVAGFVAGGVFRIYFRRNAFRERIPDDVQEAIDENIGPVPDGDADTTGGSG